MERSRVVTYILIAVVLGPLLVSTLPLIAPEAPRTSLEAYEKSPHTMEERRGITSDAEERGELLGPIVEPEGRRLPPLPALWLLDFSLALSVYLITRRLFP